MVMEYCHYYLPRIADQETVNHICTVREAKPEKAEIILFSVFAMSSFCPISLKFDFVLKRIACMRRPFITDIGKVLCMDQTTATRNIGLLERAGFVAVGVHPDDARKKVVELTPEGQAKLEEAFPLWEEAQREIREYLGDDRLGNLCSLLQVLSDFSSE